MGPGTPASAGRSRRTTTAVADGANRLPPTRVKLETDLDDSRQPPAKPSSHPGRLVRAGNGLQNPPSTPLPSCSSPPPPHPSSPTPPPLPRRPGPTPEPSVTGSPASPASAPCGGKLPPCRSARGSALARRVPRRGGRNARPVSRTIRPDPGQGGAPPAAEAPSGRPRRRRRGRGRTSLTRRLWGRVVSPPGEGIGRTRPGAGSRPRRGRFRPRTSLSSAIADGNSGHPCGTLTSSFLGATRSRDRIRRLLPGSSGRGPRTNDPPGTGLLMGRVHPAGVRNARGWHSPNRLPRKMGGQALTKRLARPLATPGCSAPAVQHLYRIATILRRCGCRIALVDWAIPVRFGRLWCLRPRGTSRPGHRLSPLLPVVRERSITA